MVFYGCGVSGLVYKYVANIWLQLLICLTVNLVGGYIFYRIENKITTKIIKKVKERNYYSDVVHSISDRCNSIASK